MNLKEQLYSVLIVSNAEGFNSALTQMLPPSVYRPVRCALGINEAKQLISDRKYDLVIINAPLPDDFGTRFAIDCCHRRNTVVLIIVKSEIYAQMYDKVLDYGVFVLPKPCSQRTVSQALDWMCCTRERLRGLEQKTLSVEEKMQEIRIVNRAKWILIREKQMTEEEAHRYIEKSAMDRCISKREVAEEIIN